MQANRMRTNLNLLPVAVLAFFTSTSALAAAKPNIVVILTDDK